MLSTRQRHATKNSISYKTTDLNSGGAKFSYGISGDADSRQFNSREITVNARNSVHDSVESSAIVRGYSDFVVDTGIIIQPTCNAELLGLTDEQAEQWNTEVASKFDLYFNSKKCHRARLFTGYQAQALMMKAILTDNDVFIRFYFEKEKDALSTVSFEFVDTLAIQGSGITFTGGEMIASDGIVRDHRGRETAFKISRTKSDGSVEIVTVPAKSNGRIMMVHGFIPDQVSQSRGYSQMSHLLQEFQLLGDFKLSHIQKAISQASVAMAVINETGKTPSNVFEGYLDVDTPAGTSPVEFTDDTLTEPTSDIHVNKLKNFNTLGDGSMTLVNMGAGDKIQSISNTAPVTNYDVFVDSFVKSLSASSGMGIEIMQKKFGSNYSASRAALLLFYRVAEIYRMQIDTDFLTPIYENWLSEEIAAGSIKCHGWQNAKLRAAWMAHTLISAPVPNIDPKKTIDATREEVALSVTTLDQAAQKINGGNGKANRAANRRQFAELPRAPWEQQILESIPNDKEDDDDDN